MFSLFVFLVGRTPLSLRIFSPLALVFSFQSRVLHSLTHPVGGVLCGHIEFIFCTKSRCNFYAESWTSYSVLLSSVPCKVQPCPLSSSLLLIPFTHCTCCPLCGPFFSVVHEVSKHEDEMNILFNILCFSFLNYHSLLCMFSTF